MDGCAAESGQPVTISHILFPSQGISLVSYILTITSLALVFPYLIYSISVQQAVISLKVNFPILQLPNFISFCSKTAWNSCLRVQCSVFPQCSLLTPCQSGFHWLIHSLQSTSMHCRIHAQCSLICLAVPIASDVLFF